MVFITYFLCCYGYIMFLKHYDIFSRYFHKPYGFQATLRQSLKFHYFEPP